MAEALADYLIEEDNSALLEESERIDAFKIRVDLANLPTMIANICKVITKASFLALYIYYSLTTLK